MSFFDICGLIAVSTFYALLVGKIDFLMRRGRRVVQLGKGKEGFGKHLERSFWLGMGLLTFFVVMAAFRIPYPGIGEPITLFGGTWSKITGFFLLNAAIVSFSFALAAFRDAFRHQSKKEEKKLAREFPKSYAAYLARTRKWFGPPKKD